MLSHQNKPAHGSLDQSCLSPYREAPYTCRKGSRRSEHQASHKVSERASRVSHHILAPTHVSYPSAANTLPRGTAGIFVNKAAGVKQNLEKLRWHGTDSQEWSRTFNSKISKTMSVVGHGPISIPDWTLRLEGVVTKDLEWPDGYRHYAR